MGRFHYSPHTLTLSDFKLLDVPSNMPTLRVRPGRTLGEPQHPPNNQQRRRRQQQQQQQSQESTSSRESGSLGFALRPILLRSPEHHVSQSSCCSQQSSGTSSSSIQGECTSLCVDSNQSSDEDGWGSEDCSTPRAKEFRIPDMLFCPPAPMKRKASLRFRAVPRGGYFIVPDLEAFLPLEKIPVRD